MATELLPVAVTVFVLIALFFPADAQIGACYGMNGNNLPSKQDVINLYKSNSIGSMRLYGPDLPTLQALQNSGINLLLDAPDVQSLASDQSVANQWVQTNVAPFSSFIKYIAVGNEVVPSSNLAQSVVPAMQNVLNALNSLVPGNQIKVSTAISMSLIENSPPPSQGEFSDTSYMTSIVDFLTRNGSPLLVNVYTYFAYRDDKSIDIDFVLGSATNPFMDNGIAYKSMFAALVDSVYTALGKIGAPDMKVVVSETGWPSAGGDADTTTVDNAREYYKNVIDSVKQGTPLKQGQALETYLFAMFDENQKQGDATEQHYGLFTPDQQSKYQLTFN